MIRLNVFIKVNQANKSRLSAVAKELTQASLNDEGCIAYDIFESLTRQDVMMICETWRDKEALSKHEAAEHFTRLVPQLHALSDEMKTEKFDF